MDTLSEEGLGVDLSSREARVRSAMHRNRRSGEAGEQDDKMVMHHMFRHLKKWRTVEASLDYSQKYEEVVLRRASVKQVLRAEIGATEFSQDQILRLVVAAKLAHDGMELSEALHAEIVDPILSVAQGRWNIVGEREELRR